MPLVRRFDISGCKCGGDGVVGGGDVGGGVLKNRFWGSAKKTTCVLVSSGKITLVVSHDRLATTDLVNSQAILLEVTCLST